jgi:hypothetical protein
VCICVCVYACVCGAASTSSPQASGSTATTSWPPWCARSREKKERVRKSQRGCESARAGGRASEGCYGGGVGVNRTNKNTSAAAARVCMRALTSAANEANARTAALVVSMARFARPLTSSGSLSLYLSRALSPSRRSSPR